MVNLKKPQDAQLKPETQERLRMIVDPLLSKHGLHTHTAKVGIILDWSGSMEDPERRYYSSGQIQQLCERLIALGHRFDDDGQIDIFAYHRSGMYIGSVNALDLEGANIEQMIRAKMGGLGGTDYASGIKAFRNYAGKEPLPAKVPWYLCFVTDGSNQGSTTDCINEFKALSEEPVFVQCIALGADYDSREGKAKKAGWFTAGNDQVPTEFAFLGRLDSNVPGRKVDNTNFFATTEPNALNDEEFFDRMMGEYPQWLMVAKQAGILA